MKNIHIIPFLMLLMSCSSKEYVFPKTPVLGDRVIHQYADSIIEANLYDTLKNRFIARYPTSSSAVWLQQYFLMKNRFTLTAVNTNEIFGVIVFKYFKDPFMKDLFIIAIDGEFNVFFLHGFSECNINRLILKSGFKFSKTNSKLLAELYLTTVDVDPDWQNEIMTDKEFDEYFPNSRIKDQVPFLYDSLSQIIQFFTIEKEVGWIYKYLIKFDSDTIARVIKETVLIGRSRIQA